MDGQPNLTYRLVVILLIGDFETYLLTTMEDGNKCLDLNGGVVSKRDVETLMHMISNSSAPEEIKRRIMELYLTSVDARDCDDFSKSVIDIVVHKWYEVATYGIDAGLTEVVNYVNFLLS